MGKGADRSRSSRVAWDGLMVRQLSLNANIRGRERKKKVLDELPGARHEE